MKARETLICLALALATLAIYWQTFDHGFIAYDDDQYVYDNLRVRAGLSASNIAWAITTFSYANWHPLTWISLMVDTQLFGPVAGPMHVVNVMLHLGSTLLLFLALLRMTQKPWRSAIVAGVFALHPLHVESVAWIAERKDVLSTFFEMLTLLLYTRYVEAPAARRYAWIVVAFALSLMSKPMAVTLPFVLLLLDWWPLGRLVRPFKRVLWEKAPLLAMSVVASFITFKAQQSFGSVVKLNQIPFLGRLENATVAYGSYIIKALWPRDLAVLYPLHGVTFGALVSSFLLLVAVTIAALLLTRRHPYLLAGWLWYLGMLVPAIGLVQVGAQAMADRYTYVPLVGLSISLVWLIADAVEHRPLLRQCAAVLGVAALLVLAASAHRQAAYWASSRTLFEHTLAITERNHIIDNNLGVVLAEEGQSQEAIALYRAALEVDPEYADPQAHLGHELLKNGQPQQALPYLTEALRLKPDSPTIQADLGFLLATQGKLEDARLHLEESLRLAPSNPSVLSDLCFVLQRLGHISEAAASCIEALGLKPDFKDAQYNLGTALAAQGKKAEAIAEFSRILAADPSYTAARVALESLR